MKNKSTPEIRFAGFTGDWEQSKLNEVTEVIGGGTPSTEVQEYWDGDIDWYSPVEIGKETYAFGSQRKITTLGLKMSSAKVLPANKTILFTSRAGIGDMAILKKDGATNQGFQSLVVNNNYDVYFVYSVGNKIKDFALKYASGSTFLEISGKILGEMNLFVPSLKEQIKIGNFLKQLDDTIALHQQELTTLKQTKQGFLQKMFPKEGEFVPEVRFPGFTGEWEQRKLSDIYDVVSGFAFKMSDYVQVGVPIINGESIQHGSISTKNLNFLPNEFLDKYQSIILETGDIVLGLNRPITNGNLKIAQVPRDLHGALLYQRAGKIIILNNSDINFSYQLLGNEVLKFVLKEAVGSDQPFISTTKLKKWSICIPISDEEQIKIGLFFKNLDETIALHQRELDALKETKKAFLQKMYV